MFLPISTTSVLEDIKSLVLSTSGLKIITLTGRHGGGKDTYANILRGALNGEILRFADPLRDDFIRAGFDNIDIIKRTEDTFPDGTIIGGYDVSGNTARESMVYIAETNKMGRPSYYADIACSKIIEGHDKGHDLFIIPDFRFGVEEKALKKLSKNIPLLFINIDLCNACSRRNRHSPYNFILEELSFFK